MPLRPVLLATIATLALTGAAQAAPKLIAIGSLSGSAAGPNHDLSGLTGALENGLPADMLGGIGSGLAYAGNGTFLALPDRGPNATPYNPKLDDTVTFIPRFDTLKMGLTPAAAGAALPFTLSVDMSATTLLYSPTPLAYGTGAGLDIGSGTPAQNAEGRYYFTGRSDAFDPARGSCNPDNGRRDTESLRVSNDGKTVYVSDEYGPYIDAYDRATGARVANIALPANLCIAHTAAQKDAELKGNATGRTTNQGMEGLAITPDGKRLVGNIQSATLQDKADEASKKMLRLVTVDLATGATHEYGYMLTEGSGVSEIVAVNNHEFLLDERDGKGLGDDSKAKVKTLYKIDIAGATDITGLTGKAAAEAAVKKEKFFELVPALEAAGVPAEKIPSKIEGVAFGPDVTADGQTLHTLFIANDNDFLPETSGPNMFYVVGFTDADLPGYAPQPVQ